MIAHKNSKRYRNYFVTSTSKVMAYIIFLIYHSHCTGPRTGPGPGTIGFHTHFPVPGPVQCEWAITPVKVKQASPTYSLPAATKLWPRLCFYSCLWFCPQGGVCLSACWDTTHPWEQTPPRADPPGADTPRSRHPPGADTPWEQTPPRKADSSIRPMSGRYASYWNAFLYSLTVVTLSCQKQIYLFGSRHRSVIFPV